MNDHPEQAVNPKYRSRMPQLPALLQRRGNALLNQQCWIWGRDVRNVEGNLLLAYGFEQFRRPGDAVGGTAYKLDLSDDRASRSLILWGFGLYYASADFGGGIFMNRFNFSPKLSRNSRTPALRRKKRLQSGVLSRLRASTSRPDQTI